MVLRRASFEAYLCERFARGWTRTRAVLALFARGLYPGFPGKIRIPEKEVIRLRASLAGKVAGGDEKALRRALLARGWGEVGLLDRLRGRLLAERLASLGPGKRKVFPGEVRSLLEAPLPPLLPSTLEDLEGDGRARLLESLAAGKVSYFLERREGGGEVLAWLGGKPLVRTEEILVDLLGVLTETERRRAFREYLALRMAERRLGKVLRVEGKEARGGKGDRPAQAWMRRVRAAFLASPEGKASRPLLARAARRAASRGILGFFLLVPALRKSSGRPGFPGDQKKALSRALALKEALEKEETAPAEALARLRLGFSKGEAWKKVEDLEGRASGALGLEELERRMATPLDGLGLGENPAWSLLLFSRKGAWTLTSTWWGPLLFKEDGETRETSPSPALVHTLEGRMRFFAWCRSLLSGKKD